jgi:hypothetical protein
MSIFKKGFTCTKTPLACWLLVFVYLARNYLVINAVSSRRTNQVLFSLGVAVLDDVVEIKVTRLFLKVLQHQCYGRYHGNARRLAPENQTDQSKRRAQKHLTNRRTFKPADQVQEIITANQSHSQLTWDQHASLCKT